MDEVSVVKEMQLFRIRKDMLQRYYPAPSQQAIWEACRDIDLLLQKIAELHEQAAAAEYTLNLIEGVIENGIPGEKITAIERIFAERGEQANATAGGDEA